MIGFQKKVTLKLVSDRLIKLGMFKQGRSILFLIGLKISQRSILLLIGLNLHPRLFCYMIGFWNETSLSKRAYGWNLHPRLNWLVKTRHMKLETLTVSLEKRRKNTTNLSWRSNIETAQDDMEVCQENLCLILDLEGFFIKKTPVWAAVTTKNTNNTV